MGVLYFYLVFRNAVPVFPTLIIKEKSYFACGRFPEKRPKCAVLGGKVIPHVLRVGGVSAFLNFCTSAPDLAYRGGTGIGSTQQQKVLS